MKTSEKEEILDETATSANEDLSKDDISIFLRKFLLRHQKLQFESQLRIQLNKMCINSVNDLIVMQETYPRVWDMIQQNLNIFGPILTPLLKKEIDQLRLRTKLKIKHIRRKTPAEIQADIHKIKRFLFYETRIQNTATKTFIIDQISYLNYDALKLGFEEQKKDLFDGGPVMDQIKTYLEDTFTTDHLNDYIKPSHGMILVICYFYFTTAFILHLILNTIFNFFDRL